MSRPMVRILAMLALAGLPLMAASPAAAHGAADKPARAAALDPDSALEASQRAIGNVVGNYRFVESRGAALTLDELRGKPLIVSMIYTSCSHVCPMITQGVRRAVEEAERMIGAERFTVVTVGIDTRNDTPPQMAAFARAQGVRSPNWLFLSTDAETVARFAEDLGFAFAPNAGGFAHLSQTTILDREGRVYRQVYGDDFPLQVFMEPLKEAVYGTVGSFASIDGLVDRIRFLCTVYDPNQGRYRISYAIVITLLTGFVSLGATAMVISRVWLNSRRA